MKRHHCKGPCECADRRPGACECIPVREDAPQTRCFVCVEIVTAIDTDNRPTMKSPPPQVSP